MVYGPRLYPKIIVYPFSISFIMIFNMFLYFSVDFANQFLKLNFSLVLQMKDYLLKKILGDIIEINLV